MRPFSISRFSLFAISAFLFLYGSECSLAQSSAAPPKRSQFSLSHAVAQKQPLGQSSLGIGSVTIVALRVDFQDEGADSGLTTGNGKFDLSTRFRILNRDTVVDPPPHDSTYFLAHFKFLDSYYAQTSRGKLHVNSILLPGVVRMSQQMKSYSPKKTDTTNIPLAKLIREAWLRADSLGLLNGIVGSIDTSRTMFVIFHAGAGRDIDLASQFGFDPTPNDLPSIYMSDQALSTALGGNFDGISVANGAIRIRNTGLLPEAETRTIPNPQNNQQTLVIELGMNGLAAAQVGSFLGLPDLFNTSNGKTSIGQLGLMDGSGIFGYGGIFPPEPMAWEKIRLGWVTPREVTSNDTLSILTPVYAASQNKTDQSIFRIPISADEYYLLEVRRRDANSDGARFSTYQATQGLNQPYNYIIDPRQEPNADSIWGVLTSADEYDWAAFGDKTKGGIAIWHVDESIIRATEGRDAINADVDHRGIRLEEADAIQDIGVTIQTIFGPVTPSGFQGDLWYAGNPDRKSGDAAHIDEFSANSLPPSKANNGAPSYVKLTNFSAPNNVMSVVFTRDIPQSPNAINPIVGLPSRMVGKEDGVITGIVTNDGTGWLLANADASASGRSLSNWYLWKTINGIWTKQVRDSLSGGFFSSGFAPREAALRANGTDVYLYTIEDSSALHSLTARKVSGAAVQQINSVTFPTAAASLLLKGDTVAVGIQTSSATSGFAEYSSDLSVRYSYTTSVGNVHAAALSSSGAYALSADSSLTVSGKLSAIKNASPRIYTGQLLPAGVTHGAEDLMLIGDPARASCVFDLASLQSQLCEPSATQEAALANLEGDETMEVVSQSSDHVIAYNSTAAPANNLYFTGAAGSFTSNPIVIDLAQADPGQDLLFARNGQIVAYSATSGKMVSGFPLAGGLVRKLLALQRGNLVDIFALADTATILGWTGNVGPLGLAWPMERHDAARTSHAPTLQPVSNASEFFPQKRAYAWPNPSIAGDPTHIRFYVAKDATANCLIVNDAGEEITTLTASCQGGTDNEILWDTKPLGNGIYTCRLKVTAVNGGDSGQKLIKIAVVK